ncbi:MAG: amidase, partial [Acidobacteriota bacterium]|nr:amidase [Acidobacteriota bacterium]
MLYARALIPLLLAAAGGVLTARQVPAFAVEETTIAAVHTAMRDGRLTCRALVEAYVGRIAA